VQPNTHQKPHKPAIAMVTDAIAPYHRGGKEQRYAEVAPRLTRYADVHVYTMHWWPGPRTIERDGVTYHAIAPLLPLYRHGRRSITQALVFAVACLRLLFVRFDALEADHMPYLQLFVLRLVTWIRRKRLVVTWHEVWGAAAWQDYLGRPGRIAWWIERQAMRLPDAIIAASAHTAVRLGAHVPRRVAVVAAPNGIDFDRIQEVAPCAEEIDVLGIGRLLKHKRFDLLLESIAVLKAEGLALRCTIVGDGPEREPLRQKAAELGIAELVDLRSAIVAHRDVLSLIKGSRVFVLASEREGFGIAALEAIACGVPVVTTSAPDNLASHLVRESLQGTVCEPTAPEIARAVRSLIDQAPNDHAGGAWARGYDWSTTVENAADVLVGASR